jgi:chromosome segregation ATPase
MSNEVAQFVESTHMDLLEVVEKAMGISNVIDGTLVDIETRKENVASGLLKTIEMVKHVTTEFNKYKEEAKEDMEEIKRLREALAAKTDEVKELKKELSGKVDERSVIETKESLSETAKEPQSPKETATETEISVARTVNQLWDIAVRYKELEETVISQKEYIESLEYELHRTKRLIVRRDEENNTLRKELSEKVDKCGPFGLKEALDSKSKEVENLKKELNDTLQIAMKSVIEQFLITDDSEDNENSETGPLITNVEDGYLISKLLETKATEEVTNPKEITDSVN